MFHSKTAVLCRYIPYRFKKMILIVMLHFLVGEK